MDRSSFLWAGTFRTPLRQIIRKLFRSIRLPDDYVEPLSMLEKNGHLVFVLAKANIMDMLLLMQNNRTQNLPLPKVIFGMNMTFFQPVWKLPSILIDAITGKNPFSSGTMSRYVYADNCASVLCLDKAVLRGGADPMVELLKLQHHIEKPLYLVPLRCVYAQTPIRISDAAKEEEASLKGLDKFFHLLKASEEGFIEYGDPLNLQEYTRKSSEDKLIQDAAVEIKNHLRQQIADLSRNSSGVPLKKKEWIIQTSLKDYKLAELIGTKDNPKNEADYIKAQKYLEQMASDIDPSFLRIFERILTWIFRNIYSDIDGDPSGIKRIRELSKKGPIVYIPCHKSHMDYLVLSYLLRKNGLSIPNIAAGANLSFFPLGNIFRKSGAFFMKRTFKGNELYSQTFAAYIRTLLSEKIPIEFFIEGTRSRSGKLMLPKTGLLSMIVDAWKQGGMKKDIMFVPVFIGYDLVVEEDAYAMEMKGAKKENENLKQLVKASKLLGRKYGKVYVRFSEPLSIKEFIKSNNLSIKQDYDHNLITEKLAWTVVGSIYRKTVVTSTSVIASALMSRKAAMDETDASNLFKLFIDYLTYRKYELSASFSDISRAFLDASSLLEGRGLVTIDRTEDEPAVYNVEDISRIHLVYYKNTIINCLVPLAVISNIILKLSGIPKKTLEEEYRSIIRLFSKEFSIEDAAFESSLEFMLDKKLVKKSWGNISYEKESVSVLSDIKGLITDYLESYLVVMKNVKKTGLPKDYVKVFETKADLMLKKLEIQRPESLCTPNFKGAVELLRSLDYIDRENRLIDEKGVERLVDDITGYLEK